MMAVSLDIPHSRFEGVRVSPSAIKYDEAKNGRAFPYDPTQDFSDLFEDFERGIGIQEPIIVKKVSIEGKESLELLIGFRRLLAALWWEKNKDPEFKIPALIRPVKKAESELDELINNIRENVARKDLSPVDLGSNAQRLQDSGKSLDEIATILGGTKPLSHAQITQHLRIVRELPEFVQILVHRRELTADDAFTLLKATPEKRQEILEDFLSRRGSEILDEAGEPELANSLDDEIPETPEPVKPKRAKLDSIREVASEHGVNVGTMRMSELKKYLNEAIETEGPGSHRGEIELKKKILACIDGKISRKQLDNQFARICKEKF